MIKSIRHKGLRRFYERGDSSKVQQDHIRRLRMILARLATAESIDDMNYPGARLHQLSGDMKGYWSVTVSGNYRIVFQFEDGDAYDIDYLDYH
jgi:proteic killer suppression protein